ncbi:MAG: hypothetical protein ACTSP4_03195 [Candidatus Hodarchaeales archaeon]
MDTGISSDFQIIQETNDSDMQLNNILKNNPVTRSYTPVDSEANSILRQYSEQSQENSISIDGLKRQINPPSIKQLVRQNIPLIHQL